MAKKNGKLPISSKYLIVSTPLKALSDTINSRVFENPDDVKITHHWREEWFSVYNYQSASLVVTDKCNKTSCLSFDPSTGDFDDEREGCTTRIPVSGDWFDSSVTELESNLNRTVTGREFSVAFNFSLAYYIVRTALFSPKDVFDIGNLIIYVDPSEFPGFRSLCLNLGNVTWTITTAKPPNGWESESTSFGLGILRERKRRWLINLFRESESCEHPPDVEKMELDKESSFPGPEDGVDKP